MRYLILISFVFTSGMSFSQDIIGNWKTVDDNTKKAKSYVNIWKEKDGTYFGKVIDILNPIDKEKLCVECRGEKYNKPILGMTIIEGLSKSGGEFKNGTILDPENGKQYKCKIWIDSTGNLKVRGYWGPFYRSQTWLKF